MTAYSVAEAKNRLPSLIDKALAGEEVIITRRGEAVVELRPAARQTAPAAGTRHCRQLSRSRIVTVSSLKLWLSIVMQNGVPASS